MANKKNWLAMLAMVLAFVMAVVGYDTGTTGGNSNSTSGNNPTTTVDRSYTEDDVYVASLGVMMHYYFSTTPEGMEQAAFDNGITSIQPPIKNTAWVLNSSLDNNVKEAMNSKGATYSGTVYVEGGYTVIAINKKSGGSWYYTIYTLS